MDTQKLRDVAGPDKPARSARWRLILRACQQARAVASHAGVSEAARQFAFALAAVDPQIRSHALEVLVSLAAKGRAVLPQVVAIERAWADIDQLRGSPQRSPLRARRRPPHADRREPLRVEAARAMPLDRILDHLGIESCRRGRSVVAPCPFHDDHHPSLQLDLRHGLWYCFPCDRGGDGIALVMQVKGLPFAEAVREVAP